MLHRNRSAFGLLFFFLVVVAPLCHTNADESAAATEEQTTINPETDWGSFYDPKNVFCGKYDCYKILGFDYFHWGDDPPSIKDITKSYRSLSRQWHPDKNKERGAREKFVAIAKAYEVLTDSTKRTEYDRFRDRPDEYFRKYGSGVLWEYAPKSDTTFVVLLFLIVGSAFTYYAQKNRYNQIANHLIRAAVADLSVAEGGSAESEDIRARALDILAEQKATSDASVKTSAEESVAVKKGKSGDRNKKKGSKVASKEKKKDQEELRPIIVQLVNEIDDFGAGFRKPTLHDLLVVRMVKWPYYWTKSAIWWSKYFIRRVKNLDYNDDEREALTIHAVGEVAWVAASDEDRAKMLTLDLWVMDNLVLWKEEQELKLLSNRERKLYKKYMKNKKGGNIDAELLDDKLD